MTWIELNDLIDAGQCDPQINASAVGHGYLTRGVRVPLGFDDQRGLARWQTGQGSDTADVGGGLGTAGRLKGSPRNRQTNGVADGDADSADLAAGGVTDVCHQHVDGASVVVCLRGRVAAGLSGVTRTINHLRVGSRLVRWVVFAATGELGQQQERQAESTNMGQRTTAKGTLR